MGRVASDKRERLIHSAIACFHQQGFQNTALGDVALASGVPVGNIFYYFKTKAELAQAVVDEWCHRLSGYLLILEGQESDPANRLLSFLVQTEAQGKMYATLGCPLASLVRDLRQAGPPLSNEACRIYQVQQDWLHAQFRALGFQEQEAKTHTRFLMSGVQGAILLTYAQQDESFLRQEINAMTQWLKKMLKRMPRDLDTVNQMKLNTNKRKDV
ncbi:MAG: TetR/AcrR family transcriptional regulator [Cyanobacteria bacterium]|nr:TetR/AcrR family transcriptional regulator [Cyanobacteriota bacterium]